MDNNTNFNGSELNSQHDKIDFINVNSFNLDDILNTNSKITNTMPNHPSIKNENTVQSIKTETAGLDHIAKNQEDIDKFYQTTLDKRWSLVDRWTNNTMFKQVQDVKLELFQTSAKYRLNFYKTILDTRLEYLNEKCNAGLKMVKGHYRHQVSSFLMNKMEQLNFEVKDKQITFMQMMKEKYSYAETLEKYPSMKKRFFESIFNEEINYMKFLDGLLDRFQSIVDEELQKYN